MERKDRVQALILSHARDILATNKDVALELGLIQRAPRQALLRQNARLEVRRERMKRRNLERGSTFSMHVPNHIFEIASTMWEPPADVEPEEYNIFFPATIKAYGAWLTWRASRENTCEK